MMSKILVIITQANLNQLNVNETLSAVMVLATFGIETNVLLQDAGLSLLNDKIQFDTAKHPFKVASNLLESFEFYDLLPVLIEEKYQANPFVKNSQIETKHIIFNDEFIQQYQHVLYF